MNIYAQQFSSCVKDGISTATITASNVIIPRCLIACRSCKHSNNSDFWCTEDHYMRRQNVSFLVNPKFIKHMKNNFPELFI